VPLQLTVELIAVSSTNRPLITLTTCYQGALSIAGVCTVVGGVLKGTRFQKLQQAMRRIEDLLKDKASTVGIVDKFINASNEEEQKDVLAQISYLVTPLVENTSDVQSLRSFLEDPKQIQERIHSDRVIIGQLTRDIYNCQYDPQGKLRT
jgi:hypothetical protein